MKKRSVSPLFFFIVSLNLIGCGKGVVGTPGERGTFEPYFQSFESVSTNQDRSTYGDTSVSMVFGEVQNGDTAAQCDPSSLTITVSKDDWTTLTEGQRTALIWHELGHCLLRRNHLPGPMNYQLSCPASIMNAHLVSDGCFSAYKDIYEKELFSHSS